MAENDSVDSVSVSLMSDSTRLKLRAIEVRNQQLHAEHAQLLAELDGLASCKAKLSRLAQYMATGLDHQSFDNELLLVQNFMTMAANDPTVLESDYRFWVDKILSAMSSGRKRYQYAYLYSCLLIEWSTSVVAEQQAEQPAADSFADEEVQAVLRGLADVTAPQPQASVDARRAKMADWLAALEGRVPQLLAVLRAGCSQLDGYLSVTSQDVEAALRWSAQCDLFPVEQRATIGKLAADAQVVKELASSFHVLASEPDKWQWDAPVRLQLRRCSSGKLRAFPVGNAFTLLFLSTVALKLSQAIAAQFSLAAASDYQCWRCPEATLQRGGAASTTAAASSKQQSPGEEIVQHAGLGCLEQAWVSEHLGYVMHVLKRHTQDSSSSSAYGSTNPTTDTSGPCSQNIVNSLQAMSYVHTQLDPDCRVFVGFLDFARFGQSLHHDAVEALLRFLHVSPGAVALIMAFLRVDVVPPTSPASSSSSSDSDDGEALRCTRGTLTAMHMSHLIGELLLFVLETDVLANTSVRLWRVHDDVWLLSKEPALFAAAVQRIHHFCDVFGLSINRDKSGYRVLRNPASTAKHAPVAVDLPTDNDVGFGFLKLAADGSSDIVDGAVELFAEQMKAELARQTSVVGWSRCFNTWITRFEAKFGVFSVLMHQRYLALCRDALTKLLSLVLPPSPAGEPVAGLVHCIDAMIKSKPYGKILAAADCISVPWIFLPVTAGGLGIRNPFLHLHSLEAAVSTSRETFLTAALNEERRLAADFEQRWQQLEPKRRGRLVTVDQLRKAYFSALTHAYSQLYTNVKAHITATGPHWGLQQSAFNNQLDYAENLREFTQRGAEVFESDQAVNLKPYFQWVVFRYLPQLRQEFGSIAFLDTKLVPYGLLSTLAKGVALG